MDVILSGNESVDQMIGVDITGNIIPPVWFATVLRPKTQKPYFLAILLLSDIVYWFRPIEYRDEATGKTCGYKSKLRGRYLTKTYNSYAEYFGVSKREVKAALDYLADGLGVITRAFELVAGNPESNEAKVYTGRIFIDLNVEKLKELTFPTEPSEDCEGVVHENVGVVHKNVGGGTHPRMGSTQTCRGGTQKRKYKENINKRVNKENIKEINKDTLSYLSYPEGGQDGNDPVPGSDQIEDEILERENIEKLIKHNISYEDYIRNPSMINFGDLEMYQEIVRILVDTANSNSRTITIGGDRKPLKLVKERFLQLDAMDIEYVMQALGEQTGDIRNIRNYILTALFNAKTTISNYYARKVAHDFRNSG